jgi:hypothetical protein
LRNPTRFYVSNLVGLHEALLSRCVCAMSNL